jgi:hypothetical protein
VSVDVGLSVDRCVSCSHAVTVKVCNRTQCDQGSRSILNYDYDFASCRNVQGHKLDDIYPRK